KSVRCPIHYQRQNATMLPEPLDGFSLLYRKLVLPCLQATELQIENHQTDGIFHKFYARDCKHTPGLIPDPSQKIQEWLCDYPGALFLHPKLKTPLLLQHFLSIRATI